MKKLLMLFGSLALVIGCSSSSETMPESIIDIDSSTFDADSSTLDTNVQADVGPDTNQDTNQIDSNQVDTASEDVVVDTLQDVAVDTIQPDTSTPDTSTVDTSVPDTNVVDTSVLDTSVPDTSVLDTSVLDTSVPDTSTPDTSVPDTSIPDTAQDTKVADVTQEPDVIPIPKCPNGIMESGETCDDNNSAVCDGCELCQRRGFVRLPLKGKIQITDDTAQLLQLTKNGSIEFWYKLNRSLGQCDSTSGEHSSQETTLAVTRDYNWRVEISTNSVRVAINAATIYNITTIVEPVGSPVWHHFAWDFYLSSMGQTVSNLWMDGVMVKSSVIPGDVRPTASPTYNVLIEMNKGYCITGQTTPASVDFDELRINSRFPYNTSFIPARRVSSLATNLTYGLWHFDEAASPFLDSRVAIGIKVPQNATSTTVIPMLDDCYNHKFNL